MTVPAPRDLLWPTLKALKTKGGSASIQELYEQIAADLNLPDEVLDEPFPRSPLGKLGYHLHWARTGLKKYGLIDNPSRGVWAITPQGRKIETEDELFEHIRNNRGSRRSEIDHEGYETPNQENSNSLDELEWQASLLDILQNMEPDAFERLCQRILRESGFIEVNVTGRSGDGGIDGTGILRIRLLSFHVRFQCKRYKGQVGSRDMRDFRGASAGRGDKGLFLTTGKFSREAKREATRDGVPSIDLIEGIDLCDLLKDLRMGVKTTETVTPVKEYFDNI